MTKSADQYPDLFIYTVRYDIGFAPNPFYGYCTLATCKSGIRKMAQIGDWIVGVCSVSKCQKNKLVYAMKVEECLTYDEYWADPRFERKRPFRSGSIKQRYGDNIYHRNSAHADWIQEDSSHSRKDGTPNPGHVARDTKHPRVLISQTFVYFGEAAIDIPEEIRTSADKDLFVAIRSYRRNIDPTLKLKIIEWIEGLLSDINIQGDPLGWLNHP